MAYFQIYGILLSHQYNRYDKNKSISISEDRLSLTVIQNDVKKVIKSEDVVNIEVYEGKSLGKFTNLSYIIINTVANEEILITQLTIPFLIYDKILETFLRKKPRVYFKKNINFIKDQPIL
ncbi:MAG: hypothetical protein V4592_18440 [Bacteroidota bacterium]